MARRKRSPRTPPTPATEAVPPAVAPRPRSRRRWWLFRGLAVLFPLLVLGLLNLLLYALNVGFDTRVVIPVTTAGNNNTYCLNEYASQAYFDDRELAGPDTQPFELPRPAKTLRIVVLGESSVEGFPYYTELAFPRQIEHYLSAQWPDQRIEVINAGMVGINSFALVDFVPRMLACQPDVVVMYAGHNEFYGPGGVGSTATLSPGLYPTMTYLRRWRLYQWLRSMTRPSSSPDMLIAALPRDLEIPWDGPAYTAANQYFRGHLESIADLLEEKQIPFVLCSVASNLSDQSPVSSLSRPGLTADQLAQVEAWRHEGEAALQQGQSAEALEKLTQATAIDDGSALLAFRRAQCLAATGDRAQALSWFRRARDLDGCRFRAPSSLRDTTREVATDPRRSRCVHVDIEEVLLGVTQKVAPGNDYFMEHVHFTFAGHREVARALARTITQDVLHGTWNPARQPSDEEMAHLCGVTTYDHINALYFAMTIVYEPPFNKAPDHQQQFDFLNTCFKDHVRTLSYDDQMMFKDLDLQLRQIDMINGLAAALVKRGELQRALEMFQTAQRRRPWEITAYIGAAKCLTELQRPQEALAYIDQALALAPRDADLLQIRADLAR